MANELREKTINGFFWQLGQKISCQLISFGISVVLARLLSPNDYGVVAICSMFLMLVGIIIDGGLGTALIQKKDIDEIDFNTVFYAGTVFSFIIYAITFVIAPFIAVLFDNEQITPVIRVLAILMPVGTLSSVQSAFIQRQMAFRKYFISSLYGTIASGCIGLIMAFMGFGVWALVGQSLVNTLTNTIVLFIINQWRPKWMFSWERFRILFSFGWRMVAVNVLNAFFYQLKGYVIGYKYSASDLAYYNRGEGLPGILYNNISSTINTVLFPALSNLQDDKQAIKHALARSMRTTCFFLMPALLGLAAISDKLVLTIFTEKWAAAIPFMQVICFISCSDILGMANYQAIKALGKVDVLLKMEFYKRPLMFFILIITMFISPLAIAVGQLFYSVSATLFNAWPNKKYINYSITEQFSDIGHSFLSALAMAFVVYMIGRIDFNIYGSIGLQITVGTILYLLLSWIFNKKDLQYIMRLVKEKLLRR